jgi:hypothetical protein
LINQSIDDIDKEKWLDSWILMKNFNN